MVGINFLNYMDRWVASAAATSIEKEFHLTNSQFGLIGTAFLLVYAVAALPFGYWGDRGVRKTVIGVGVTIWSLATLFTGFARSYFQLFLSRAIVGVGEASYYPAGTSLMSDYFPKELRSRVMSVWNAGSTIGIAVGFAGGGLIAEKFGWRTAFYFAAVPGLLFALLAFGFKEPLRGLAEKQGPVVVQTRDVNLRRFLDLWRIPTLRATILAQTLLYFVLASNAFWLPTVLQRRFDMSESGAGLLSEVVIVAHLCAESHSTYAVGEISACPRTSVPAALLSTRRTPIILAAIAAATGLRTVKKDTEAMETEWAMRPTEPVLSR